MTYDIDKKGEDETKNIDKKQENETKKTRVKSEVKNITILKILLIIFFLKLRRFKTNLELFCKKTRETKPTNEYQKRQRMQKNCDR